MTARMALPEGCYGLEMQDGKKYNADRNGRVLVADRHVGAVKNQYGPLGLIAVEEPHTLGTKLARICPNHPLTRWQAWSEHCPKCGAETQLEEQQ
jgi:hypothetical protein